MMKSYVADSWSFDPAKGVLKRAGEKSVKLPNKAAQVLNLFCQNPGQLLDRYQIIEEVWEGNVAVGELGLRQIIWRLRKELPDIETEQPAIINVPRKGYRLRDSVTTSSTVLPARLTRKYQLVALSGLSAALILMLAAYIYSNTSSNLILEVLPVTTQSGYEESPAISPDNATLLYSANADTSFDIYRRDLSEPDQQDQLFLEQQANLGGMSWNRQGDKFAYLATTDNPDVDEVYLYDMQTAESRLIASQHIPTFSSAPYGLAWSPTEDILAYTSKVEDRSKSALFLYDHQTQQHRQLTQPDYIDLHPAWSPDGRVVSFHRIINPESAGLYSVAVESGEMRELTRSNIKIYGHVWLDDQYILYSGYDNGFFYPFVLDTRTLEAARIDIPGNFKYPIASATDIFYIRSSLERQIQQHGLIDGRLRLEQIIDSTGSETYPQVHTPSGRLIFISDRTGHKELWYRANPDAKLRQLTKKESVIEYPSFSSSGRFVSYRQFNHDSMQLELGVYDLDRQTEIAVPVINTMLGIFVGADRYIVNLTAAEEGRELWLFDLENQSTKRLATGVWVQIGADQANQVFYFVKNGQIHSYDLRTEQSKPLVSQPAFQPPASVNGASLFYFEPDGESFTLIEHNLHTDVRSSRFMLESALYTKLSEFSFNPDSGRIYLNIISKRESDIYSFSRAQLRTEIKRLFP